MRRALIVRNVIWTWLLIGSVTLCAQTTWTGATSSDWFLASNWSAGVPTASISATIPAGTPFSPEIASGTGATLGLTVALGASLNLLAGTQVDVHASLSVVGAISGSGTVRLTGSASASLSGGGMLPSLEVAKTAADANLAGHLTVVGDLLQTSGTLRVSNSGTFTLTVNGDAQFSGGILLVNFIGTIDVAGDVTFAGTTCTASSPTIRCAGNWTADSAYAPTSGTVFLDGAVQTISGSGPRFPTLNVALGSTTTATTNLILSVGLTVLGSLDFGTQTFAASGALNVSGSLILGSGTSTVGGTVTVSSAVTGAGSIRMIGATSASLNGGGLISNLEVAKTGAGIVEFTGHLTIVGDLLQSSGTLRVSNSGTFTLTVNGDAQFSGGNLLVNFIGTIDVAGDVTFAGTSCTGTSPTIRCAGNWTGDSVYAPTGGTVFLDGTVQTISGSGPRFPTLNVASGSTTTASANLIMSLGLTVPGSLNCSSQTFAANGDLNVSGSLNLGSGTSTVAGTVTVSSAVTGAGSIRMIGTTSASLNGGGLISNLEVAKTGAALVDLGSSFTIVGDLLQTSGTLRVSNPATYTLTVGGDAQFSGGILLINFTGTIDVAGDVTFAGTSCSGTSPTIRCAGNWTADAAYAPTGGTVFLDGAMQTISGSGPRFPTLNVALGSTTTATTNLILSVGLTVPGSLDFGTQTFAASGALNVSGSLILGSGTSTVGGTVTVSSAVTGAGSIRMIGTTSASLNGGGLLSNLEVAKTGAALVDLGSNFSIVDDLLQTSGTLRVSNPATYTLTVGGDAQFSGGILAVNFTGTIDVAGDVTFAGTSCTGTSPTIRCAGNWTADAAYAPTGGTVFLDGAVQTISGSGPRFPTLNVALGSTTTATTNLILSVGLTVPGSLDFGTQTFAASGALNVSGSLILGSGPSSVGGTVTVSSAVTGAGSIRMIGTTSASLNGGGLISNLEVAKTGAALVDLGSNFTIVDGLLQTSGTLRVSNPATYTLTVGGDAQFSGGILLVNFTGTIDVAGDVTFAGTSCTGTSPTIRCAGNWTADAAYAPTGGSVFLDGASLTTVTSTGGATLIFPTLQLQNGTRQLGGSLLSVDADSLVVASGAGLDLGSSRLELLCPTSTISGSLNVGAGGTLALAGTSAMTVGTTGSLSLIGASGSPATVTSTGLGGFGFTISGALAASNFVFERMGAAGILINTSSTFAAAPNDLRAGVFSRPFPSAGAVLLDLRRSASTDLRFLNFENPDAIAGTFNVKTPLSNPGIITFINYGGAISGPAFENDPGSRIEWAAPQSTTLLSFAATAGVAQVTLAWTSVAEPDIDNYLLSKATSAGGPYSVIATIPATGAGTYSYLDTMVMGGTTYHYRLLEQILVLGTTQLLGSASATPSALSSQLNYGTPPSTPVVAGATWPTFTVRVEDAFGGLNTVATNTVTVVPLGGGWLTGTLSKSAVGGIATFDDLVASLAGFRSFLVTSSGLTGIGSTTVQVLAAPADRLDFGIAPASPAVAGMTWSTFTVRAEDPFGNLVSSFTGPITISLTAGTGSLTGTLVRTASSGTATFNDLEYSLAETVTITAFAAGLTSDSASVTVQNASASQLAFGTPPASTFVAGTTLPPFTVEVRDQFGNLVPTASDTITLSLHTGTGPLLGTLSAVASGGVATFTGIGSERAELIRIRATTPTPGITQVISSLITVAHAAPDRLNFAAVPNTLQVVNVPLGNIQVRVEDAFGNLATSATDAVTLSLPGLVGMISGSTSVTPSSGIATLSGLSFDTAQTRTALWTSPGLASLSTTFIVVPYVSDLAIGGGGLRAVPAAPLVGQPTQILVDVRNAGQVNASGQVSVYAGNPDLGAPLLGQTTGAIGVGQTVTFSIAWTPLITGLQTLTARVMNLAPPDETPGNNRASITVPVGASAETIAVHAGERVGWPGSQSSVAVTMRNTGAGSATITSVGVNSAWLSFTAPPIGGTLAPGATVVVLGQLSVPLGTPGGPLGGAPIDHPITVSIGTATGSYTGDLLVHVFDQPTGSLTLRVRNDATNALLPGALVAFQDLDAVLVTNATGEVDVALPKGARGVGVYKQGFIAASAVVVVTDGLTSAEIRLVPGSTLGVQSIVSQPLSTAEILARGVSVIDPVNNEIVDFVVSMTFGSPITVPNVEVPRSGFPAPLGGLQTFTREAVTIPGQGEADIYGTFVYDSTTGGRTETWMIVGLGGAIQFLKEFFEVTIVVVNRTNAATPSDIQLRSVIASLGILPAGLGLPDLEGAPQVLAQSLPDLDAGESAQATWIVRGDQPGTYQLSSTVTTDLYALNTLLTPIASSTVTNPFKVTFPVIQCAFHTPSSVMALASFDFGVEVTNQTEERTVNFVRVFLEATRLVSCHLAGTQTGTPGPDPRPAVLEYDALSNIVRGVVDLGDLEPGIGRLATFQVISEVTGTVEALHIEAGCGREPSPPVEVTPNPPSIDVPPASQTLCEAQTATFTVVASGAIPLSYQWRKGGLDIPGAMLASLSVGPLTAADAGSYDVVVTNGGGSATSAPATLTVLPLPVAAFSTTNVSGLPGLVVSFTDLSAGTIASRSWDFGDGGTSTVADPSHQYMNPGTYTVSLTVFGACGSNTSTQVDLVTVVLPPPSASFSGGPLTGVAPHLVNFADASTGAITSWLWSFGDGGTSTAQHPSHTYTVPGTYSVSLTVSGPGGSDTFTLPNYVTVQHPAPLITSFMTSSILIRNDETITLVADFANGVGVVDQGVGFVQDLVPVVVTPPSDALTTYTLTVTNPVGVFVTQSLTVETIPPPTIESFTASAPTVFNGQTVDLVFVFTGGDGVVQISGQMGATPVVSGSPLTVTPASSTTTTYLLIVTNALFDEALAMVNVTAISGLPEIVTHPVNTSVLAGAPVTLSVVAIGPGPLSYQWFLDGNAILGAQADTFFIASASAADAGIYTVEVTNAFGSVTPDPATLTVITSCTTCDGNTITVQNDIRINFNTYPPSYVGDAALLPYFSYDTSGPTPDTWKAIFDVGSKALVLNRCVIIETRTVPLNGVVRRAPGIEIRSDCRIRIKRGASVEVRSHQADAGDIVISAGGNLEIEGCVLNRTQGAQGRSGRITLASLCGDIEIDRRALVQTEVSGDIRIVNGGGVGSMQGGDIRIAGLVEALYRSIDAPTVRIVAFDGTVLIDGREPLCLALWSQSISTSGVIVRATRNCTEAGQIQIQASGDIEVRGNAIYSWAFPNPGAVAVMTKGNSGGGQIDIRSLGGRILAFDRAIDNSNHANALARNRLYSAGDLLLGATGASNSVQNFGGQPFPYMPVVDASGRGTSPGGTNELRSFAGQIQVLGPYATVLAPGGSASAPVGTNLLTSCSGVGISGIVWPSDLNITDDTGVCLPPAPTPLFVTPLSP